MSSGQAYDFGVPALLGIWILIGGLAAAVLDRWLAKTRALNWAWITTRPRSRL